ncbi:metalloprotease TIKI homolog isoform X2 [Dendronephthya gigantea]|nr:metalloprotease TIKI homolog isoform X2 [Dendronephthya gigantea]
MAISQSLLLWVLINNLENNVQFQQTLWKRSLAEGYSETGCPSLTNDQLNSYLWVMDRNPPVYFFGTIHVPYTNVWDYIPFNSKRAFKIANNVYFELDLTDPQSFRVLERCKSLPSGVKLRDVLPTRLYKRIKRHFMYIRGKLSEWIPEEQQKIMRLSSSSLYQQLTRNWHRQRPIWIMMLLNKLTKYSVQSLAQRLPDLDTYLRDEALANRKQLGSIETVEEHCGIVNRFNSNKVIIALNQTLILHEKIRRGKENLPFTIKQLITHYNCGNLKDVIFPQDVSGIVNNANISKTRGLIQEKNFKAKRFDDYMKEALIFKRNQKMANRIVKIINELPKRRMLFAFGAGHFIGQRSIISILQSQGYNITHLKASDPLPRYGQKRKRKQCKKQKRARTRKNRMKLKRRRYRARKYCNKDISQKNLVAKSKTTTCPLCSTHDEARFAKASRSSSLSINVSQGWGNVTWLLLFITSMVGV